MSLMARLALILLLTLGIFRTSSHAQQVLVYDPGSCNQVGLRAVLDLGITRDFSLVFVRTEQDFNDNLTNGSHWQLVVVDNPLTSIVDSQPLIDYVGDGGQCILSYALLDSDIALQSAFEVASAGTYSTPQPIFCWDPAQPIWFTPFPLMEVLAGDDTGAVDGTLLEPMLGAIAVGGYVPAPSTPDQAAVVVSASGRTIVIGPALDSLESIGAFELMRNGSDFIIQGAGSGCDPVGLTTATAADHCAPVTLTTACNYDATPTYWRSPDGKKGWTQLAPAELTPTSASTITWTPTFALPSGDYYFRVDGTCGGERCTSRAAKTLLLCPEQPKHWLFGPGDEFGGNGSLGSTRDGLSQICLSYTEIENLTSLPPELTLTPDQVLWVFLGTPPDNHVLTAAEGNVLFNHVVAGGSVYIEGANAWGLDPPTAFAAVDGIEDFASQDGDDSFLGMVGLTHSGLDLTSFSGPYRQDSCDDDSTARLVPTTGELAGTNAGPIWLDDGTGGAGSYITGIFYDTDPGFGKVITQSWELGGFDGDTVTLVEAYVQALAPSAMPINFVRGDANADGGIDISDAITILSILFTPGTPAPVCTDSADVNDDGAFDIGDAISLLSSLFVFGSPSPPVPNPGCGPDPTADSLDCMAFPPCP